MVKAYIGIDIGTTYTCAYYTLEDGRSNFIFPGDNNAIRTAVYYKPNGTVIIGDAAVDPSKIVTGNVVMNVKRVIGQKEDSERVKKAAQSCRASICADEDENAAFFIPALNRVVKAEEVYTDIINYVWDEVKTKLEDYEINCVTVTCPTMYKNAERAAIIRSVQKSKIDCERRLLSEPCAAAIAFKRDIGRDGLYVIYDMGGGTFDVSLVSVKDGKYFDFIASDGDPDMGGQVFDDRLVQFVNDLFKQNFHDSIFNSDDKNKERYLRNFSQLSENCRKAKELLSSMDSADIDIEEFQMDVLAREDEEEDEEGGLYEFMDNIKLTRAKFEDMIKEYIEKSVQIVENCVRKKDKSIEDIRAVLLVGGSSCIPLIKQKLSEVFAGRCHDCENPSTAVAIGASRYAMKLELDEVTFTQYVQYDIFAEYEKRHRVYYDVIIRKGTQLPVRVEKEYMVKAKQTEGYYIDTFYEGSIDQEIYKPIKTFEYFDLPQRDCCLKYVMEMEEDGTLYCTIILQGNQDRVIHPRSRIDKDNVDQIYVRE